jgi:hypothetical protein
MIKAASIERRNVAAIIDVLMGDFLSCAIRSRRFD